MHYFRFLDLPAEIRNNIYVKVLETDGPVYLTWRKNLICHTALPGVSKQVRDEFMPITTLYAPLVVARVKNFDFRYLIAFLNRLSDAEATSLQAVPCFREIHIEVDAVRPGHDGWYGCQKLARWLKRFEHPTKKGTKVDASYEIVYGTQSLHAMKTRLEDLELDEWRPTLLSERQADEIKKMVDAIEEWFTWVQQAR